LGQDFDGADWFHWTGITPALGDNVAEICLEACRGGLIAATLSGYDSQATIEFAVAASCLKHSIEGDYNMVTMDEVAFLVGGNVSGRVQRQNLEVKHGYERRISE